MAQRVVVVTNQDLEIYNPQMLPGYSGFSAAFTPPATPTDLFLIGGAATKIMRVFRMWISTIQTTAGVNVVSLIKRSAANSGGTAVATTKVPHDSSDPAASALVQHYTANPTINGTVGNIWSGRVNSPAAATAGIGDRVMAMIDFSNLFGKPILLRSAAEQLVWNFGGAALPPGLSVIAGVDWSEENAEDVAGDA